MTKNNGSVIAEKYHKLRSVIGYYNYDPDIHSVPRTKILITF